MPEGKGLTKNSGRKAMGSNHNQPKQKPDQYPWEIGTRLTAQVQAKDLAGAKTSIIDLTEVILHESAGRGFDEVKLRMLQVLSIAGRAAYNAGANPEVLYRASLDMVQDVITAKSENELVLLVSDTIIKFVSLVPDRDLVAERKLNLAINYIREHCTESISRGALARVLRCSPSYLSTMFSRMTGRTFKEIVLSYRMERAKELLADSRKAVTEVAFEVGYGDPNYFSAVFGRVVGVPPSHYRRKVRRETGGSPGRDLAANGDRSFG